MKYLKNIFFIAFAIMSLASCEEVIELDLENATPKIVIDAAVDATAQNARVILTKSNGFYDDINLDFVADATVNLTLADGSIVNLPMIQDGIYGTFGLNISEGDNLTLTVIDGESNEYKATEKVPHNVTIDSLQIIPTDNAGPGGGGPFGGGDVQYYQIFTHWQDEVDEESFYRIRASVNDTLQTSLITLSDDINRNGDAFSQPVFQTFEEGDTVTIQLLSLDNGSFRYFSDLSNVQGQGFNSTTPYNPNSNFDNGALGYFSVFRKDEQTVILP
ncbi:MAG: DUF4249 domain-containing protein [Saprospiraceae bacterium]